MTTEDSFTGIIGRLETAKVTTLRPDRPPAPPLPFTLAQWEADTAFVGDAPQVAWLVSGALPLGVLGLVAAAGDTGKSFLLLELAVRVAWDSGDLMTSPILGGSVNAHGAVAYITAEDSKASVHRRLRSLDPEGTRSRNAKAKGRAYPLHLIPLPDAGGPFPIVEQTPGGVRATAQYEALRAELRAIRDLRLIVLDPLQAFAMADVNADPMAGQFVCSLLAKLAAETGATVLIAHHVRKTAEPPRTPEDARAAIRGTTALVDGVRVAVALWQPAEADARKVCKALELEHAPNRVAYGAVVKSNDGATRKVWTLVRADNGLLVDRSQAVAQRVTTTEAGLKALEDAIAHAAREGRPLTKTGENGLFRRRAELGDELSAMGRNRLDDMADELEHAGRIVKALATGTTVKWLDVPEGPFARGEGQFAAGASTSRGGRKLGGVCGEAARVG